MKEFNASIPKLTRGEETFLRAFFDLDTERSHAMGLTKIPRSAILAYAQECGHSEDACYDFVSIIRKLDDAHINTLAAKRENA